MPIIFGLLGPNGAGKSTLMRILIKQKKDYTGTVELFGMDLKETDIRPVIGFAPQEFAFFFDFTVEENLSTIGKLYGLGGRLLEERVGQALDCFGLEEYRKKRAADLSGGYKRLLDIALSTLHSPEILLLDEPTAGLDIGMRRKIHEAIKRIHESGTCIIITTHYLEEAAELCDKIAIISNGRLHAIGSPETLTREAGCENAKLTIEADSGAEALALKFWELGMDSLEVTGRHITAGCGQKDAVGFMNGIAIVLQENGMRVLGCEARRPSIEEAFRQIIASERTG